MATAEIARSLGLLPTLPASSPPSPPTLATPLLPAFQRFVAFVRISHSLRFFPQIVASAPRTSQAVKGAVLLSLGSTTPDLFLLQDRISAIATAKSGACTSNASTRNASRASELLLMSEPKSTNTSKTSRSYATPFDMALACVWALSDMVWMQALRRIECALTLSRG